MNFALFVHSLISDWNHGNAHFLRGVCSELVERGHDVVCYEPVDAWSLSNLIQEHGQTPVRAFKAAFPRLKVRRYDRRAIDLRAELADRDIVIVHEWNDPELVAAVGHHRMTRGNYVLFFHDTHHRSVTCEKEMARYDLAGYDGVLAFGDVIRNLYLARGWTPRAWTWHEAADARRFRSVPGVRREGDLVWIGNWGDDERTAELHEYLLEPVKALGLRARVHGVRYPEEAIQALKSAGIQYAGWVPNYRVPDVFAAFSVTVHVPRRPYARMLPGIPTIRPFEALACGIPLVCAPWQDTENLFSPGDDFLVARDGEEMTGHLENLLSNRSCASDLSASGRRTIRNRHTCGHRVDQLLEICSTLDLPAARTVAA